MKRWPLLLFSAMAAVGDVNVEGKVRVDGAARLTQQVYNDGAIGGARTFPLECDWDGIGVGNAYATLTTTCDSPGVCLRGSGLSTGDVVSRQLDLPAATTWASGKAAMTASWPSLTIAIDQAAEMTYDLGISGITAGQEVCCRMTTLDDYTAAPACFTVITGQARRG